MTDTSERTDIFYQIFEKRYADDSFSRNWITNFVPFYNGWITIWIQIFVLFPPLAYLLQNQVFSTPPIDWFGPFTHWTVMISFAYIVMSIWSNMFSFVPYLDMKWVTVALSSLAMNVTVIAFTTSWTIIHPFLLFELDWSNSGTLIEQLNTAAIHTFPFACSFFNFIFLTDAPIYITDVLMTYAVFWTYIPWNYIHYTITG